MCQLQNITMAIVHCVFVCINSQLYGQISITDIYFSDMFLPVMLCFLHHMLVVLIYHLLYSFEKDTFTAIGHHAYNTISQSTLRYLKYTNGSLYLTILSHCVSHCVHSNAVKQGFKEMKMSTTQHNISNAKQTKTGFYRASIPGEASMKSEPNRRHIMRALPHTWTIIT